MNGRRAIVGPLLLFIIAFAAFAAPSAMATGTTAYTCKKVEVGAAFLDEHCTKDAEGGKGFIHEEIEPEETLEVTASNSVTGKLETSKFKSVFAGIKIELSSSAFHTCEGGTLLTNKEEGGKMFAGGLFCGKFTKVVVTNPANCSVLGNEVEIAEGSWATGVANEGKEMFVEFGGVENKPIAEFEFTGAKCALKTMVVKVTGVADSNVMKEALPLDGATVKFTTKDTEVALKVGAQKAGFEGVFTPYSPNTERPFVVTTTAK